MFKTLKPLALSNALALSAILLCYPLQSSAQPQQQQLETMQTFLSIMNSYYGIIESTHDIASDNEKSAIIKMQKIQEVYEDMGNKAKAADVMRNVLRDSTNPTIRNAAYVLLADNLKDTGRAAEAIELLQQGLNENIKAGK